MKSSKPRGVILYEGPSQINGKPIFAIITGFHKTHNKKTGGMLQSWMLVDSVNPIRALETGADFSVCGRCKHRHFKSCYVNVPQAPRGVYAHYKKNGYPKLGEEHTQFFQGKKLRIGSYGDPTSIPITAWQKVLPLVEGFTGYTHNWKHCDPGFKTFCMASCDTVKEMEQAQAMGWRTFRVKLEGETVSTKEFICPASKEAGHVIDCVQCLNCSGTTKTTKPCPVINAHGTNWKKLNYIKGIKKLRNHKKYATAYCQ